MISGYYKKTGDTYELRPNTNSTFKFCSLMNFEETGDFAWETVMSTGL